MGYAQLSQKGEGIHLRQFSRAFIVDDGQKRVVFVSVDAGMIGNAVKRAVLQHLNKEFGNMYNHKNVLISGTHTHSSPGGFLTHLLYDLPCLGFIKETFNALVLGIAKVSYLPLFFSYPCIILSNGSLSLEIRPHTARGDDQSYRQRR